MWINRHLGNELRSLATTFAVVVITGPRQVGKTTLLERTFPEYKYVTLDAAGNAEAADTRPEEFLDRYEPPIVIDEIQYAPSLMRHIKVRVDAKRNIPGQYLITGSQSFQLMESISESLAGRAAVVPLLGLSGSEWAAYQAIRERFSYTDFLWRGSYPALWAELERLPDRNRWYQGYVATYLERDVRNLLNVGRLRDFERFLRACAYRTGQILNMSDIGRDVGISPTTSREWLSVLQASGQILLLEPYYRSLGKRLTKSPKLYFTDTGLAAYLSGFHTLDALLASPAAGFFWENYVIGQWTRWRDWHNPAASLWYWQDRTKNEVDLLVEQDRKLYAIECKRTEKPHGDALRGIRKLIDMYGEETIAHAYIACTVTQAFDVADGITAVPGWQTWDLDHDGTP